MQMHIISALMLAFLITVAWSLAYVIWNALTPYEREQIGALVSRFALPVILFVIAIGTGLFMLSPASAELF
jgi:hypothetical protein